MRDNGAALKLFPIFLIHNVCALEENTRRQKRAHCNNNYRLEKKGATIRCNNWTITCGQFIRTLVMLIRCVCRSVNRRSYSNTRIGWTPKTRWKTATPWIKWSAITTSRVRWWISRTATPRPATTSTCTSSRNVPPTTTGRPGPGSFTPTKSRSSSASRSTVQSITIRAKSRCRSGWWLIGPTSPKPGLCLFLYSWLRLIQLLWLV